MKVHLLTSLLLLSLFGGMAAIAQPPGETAESRLLRPLSMSEAVDLALQQNSTVLKSKADLEAAFGIVVQTRAVALPRVNVNSQYTATEESNVERINPRTGGFTNRAIASAFDFPDQRWSADINVVQSVYEGGRINSALRAARLTKERALLAHQTVIADVVRDVRLAYYAALLAAQQIIVQESSVKLLEQELLETRRRFEAGTVPQFNVLRAEVELANARPRHIRARNTFRLAKDTLATVLGQTRSRGTDELSMILTDRLEAVPVSYQLSEALDQAMEQRSEIAALRKAAALRDENAVSARAGYKPSVQLFAGYGARSSQFSSDLTDELHGWQAGAQLNWNIFDGLATKGRIQEADALRRKAQEEITEMGRRIDLEVRTAWTAYLEAREVLASQEKVQESAQESLRLANARAAAGTATQLDVLNAQTALTDARTTQVQALHDYAVARTRLERAVGILKR